jgi:2-amino-4-hydroxy-6-hydroxymethyldihydropteridine diphosphokinase
VTRVAIGLGSNLGDRLEHITSAFDELATVGSLVATSSLYETASVGGPEQADYINAVAMVETDLEPGALMQGLLAIERSHGRERREKWGPRTLDLDLLVYEGRTVDEPGLTVPHPRIADRRFVLEPLSEVWPDAPIGDGSTALAAMERTLDQDVVRFTREDPSEAEPAEVAAWQVFAVTMGLALAFWWLIDLVL